MTSVLVARVREYGGEEAVAELLRKANSTRTAAYLEDIGNWISFDETVALWDAGAEVTHHPQFARAVGEDAARQLNASSMAALLRSLGSPEAVYQAVAIASQSSALLELSRALASAGTSAEIAIRLADAVPTVVDCDRVGVYLWDPARDELRTAAVNRSDQADENVESTRAPSPGGPLEKLLAEPSSEPMFIDADSGDPLIRELLERVGAVASIVVPLATSDALLGFLIASVSSGSERLAPTNDLLDRLSGVAAQATTALQNGRLVDQITHKALHDELTGLANRTQFADDLRDAVALASERAGLVTLFYLDLDGFKPVNDRFGHDVGDLLLTAVGQRLCACTRAGDVVARLGGDEFAVLIESASGLDDGDSVAQRLDEAFAQPFSIKGQELRLGASVGRASFPGDADSAEGLLQLADRTMFEAKRNHATSRTEPTQAYH